MSTNHFSRCGNRGPLSFHQIHGLLGQFDAGLIGRRHQGDHGVVPFPGHGPGILDHHIHLIEQGPIAG